MPDPTPQIANAQAGEPTVMGEVHILLVQQQGGVGIMVNSSFDPFMTLGLMEMAKDSVKAQSQQPRSPIVVPHGPMPRLR